MKAAPMERAGVETAAVKPAKSAALETAAVEASTVEPPSSAAVPSAAARCVGEIWLAEDCRAQQCNCNAHHAPTFARPAFAIA